MTHLVADRLSPRSLPPTRIFLVQYQSIILGSGGAPSKPLAAAHVLQRLRFTDSCERHLASR
jgi:hypothetical protein